MVMFAIASQRSTLRSWDPFIAFLHRYQVDTAKFKAQVKQSDDGVGDSEHANAISYADMCFGNPMQSPLPRLVSALKRQIEVAEAPNADPGTFAYDPKVSESVYAVVDVLLRTRNIKIDPDDISLTNGALSALSICLHVLGNPGDEAIVLQPSYWFYPSMIDFAGLVIVPVASDPERGFDLDIEAISKAISPMTRVILLNSPNNPTGKIYGMESLSKLAAILNEENEKRRSAAKSGSDKFSPIMVVSDEAYNRIVFDGIQYKSIAEMYPYSVMVYTWGKTLLAPSERFGYIALSPLMPAEARMVLRDRLFRTQLLGWSYPNSTTARAYAEIEAADISIDVGELQARRDRIHSVLTEDGWNVTKPEGSFYMLVQVPENMFNDESELLNALREEKVLAVPGSIMDIPGWIRLSLTASDEMVEFALDAFRRIRKKQ